MSIDWQAFSALLRLFSGMFSGDTLFENRGAEGKG